MKQKYKLKKQIYLGYDSRGKQIRKWVYGNSQREIDRQAQKLRDEYENADLPTDITYEDYYNRWFETYKSKKEENTKRMYRETHAHLDNIKYLPLKSITRTDVQEIINDNWDHPSTCEKIKTVLNAVFNGAVEDGIITKKPTKGLDLPEKPDVERRILTKEEKDVIKDLINPDNDVLSNRNKTYLGILYYFGLRPEEARSLMPKDFDAGCNNLTIQRALAYSNSQSILKKTKTKKVRTIPVPEAFKPLIISYLKSNRRLYLFTTEKGTMLTKQAHKKMWSAIKKAVNEKLGGDKENDLLGKFVPYTFRYNYCTNLYYSGISTKKAAYLMGNSVEMVMKIYAQIDDSRENIDTLRSIV